MKMQSLNMQSWIRVSKWLTGVTIRGTEETPVVIKKGNDVTEDIV